MQDDTGRYRIQVVAELTGVPAATLRAWERRHGIPQPVRTEAAYRLYSARDVEMVRQLRDLCANGVSISQAARMVQGAVEAEVSSDGDRVRSLDVYGEAAARILDAVRAYNVERVDEETARAAYLGPAATVYERVFSPLLRTVGELWHEGALSIAQEHLATNAVGSVTRGIARMVQPAGDLPLVLLACFEDEDHALGMHGVAIRLASWGIRSVDLGARVPPLALADAVKRLAPNGVGLSLTFAPDVARARALADAYADVCEGLPWFVGGASASVVAPRVLLRGGIVVEGDLNTAKADIERSLRGEYAPPVKPTRR